jgi:hypothetical protein
MDECFPHVTYNGGALEYMQVDVIILSNRHCCWSALDYESYCAPVRFISFNSCSFRVCVDF